MDWDSTVYLTFAEERRQPCLDLLSRLGGDFRRILDLGCGPGNSTEALFEKYNHATIIGFDSDENMLKRARRDHPDLSFVKGTAPADLGKLTGTFDLVFSNACIQWIEDQKQLLDEVSARLHDTGVFAAQLPLTGESPFYKILDRLIGQKWTRLASLQNFHQLNPEGYYNALTERFGEVVLWQSNYYHVVDRAMVLDWYKGSGLRPYLAVLTKNEQAEFLDDLQTIIQNEYTVLADGKVFLIMPRLFFIARK